MDTEIQNQIISLPAPKTTGKRALERVMFTRRSIREYGERPLTLAELAQLFWSCQGITSKDGLRTTPSAGATYPLEVYAVVEHVTRLAPGVYHYLPGPGMHKHRQELICEGHFGKALCAHSSKQEFIRAVPVNIVFAAIEQRTRKEYGDAAPKYVLLEIGCAAQNLHLQAEALGLGSVAIGYCQREKFQAVLQTEAEPLYFVSVGRKKRA